MPIRKLTTTIITASALGGLMGAALAGTAGAAAPSAPTSAVVLLHDGHRRHRGGLGTITGHGQADFADAAASLTVDIPAGALGSSGLAASALAGEARSRSSWPRHRLRGRPARELVSPRGSYGSPGALSSLDQARRRARAIPASWPPTLGDVGSLVSSAKADGGGP